VKEEPLSPVRPSLTHPLISRLRLESKNFHSCRTPLISWFGRSNLFVMRHVCGHVACILYFLNSQEMHTVATSLSWLNDLLISNMELIIYYTSIYYRLWPFLWAKVQLNPTIASSLLLHKHHTINYMSCCNVRVWQCLVPSKFQKFYKISRHIKSLDACMEH
jgi:hypothetical protein